jgi:hypothetical protein
MHFCVARRVFRELYSSDTKSKYMALNRIFFAIVVGRLFLISAKFSKWWQFKEKLRFLQIFFFWIKEWIKNIKINLSKKPPYDDSHLFSALCRSNMRLNRFNTVLRMRAQFLKRQFREKRIQNFAVELLAGKVGRYTCIYHSRCFGIRGGYDFIF